MGKHSLGNRINIALLQLKLRVRKSNPGEGESVPSKEVAGVKQTVNCGAWGSNNERCGPTPGPMEKSRMASVI